MKYLIFGSLSLFLVLGAHAALPGDSAEGQRLHQASCTGCHDTSVYTRPNRQVRSLDALRQQVAGCSRLAKKEFSATETEDLIKYLNDRFYHFQ